ncbi:putative OsmC-like protein [Paenibacillus sp. OAE614]
MAGERREKAIATKLRFVPNRLDHWVVISGGLFYLDLNFACANWIFLLHKPLEFPYIYNYYFSYRIYRKFRRWHGGKNQWEAKSNMADLNEYLKQKRNALLLRRAKAEAEPAQAVNTLRAKVSAKGRSGVREIRIRDYRVISDSPPDFAGYDLGPSSPELQLGVLGSCLTHITLIQAAEREVSLHSLEVEVEAQMHPLAGRPGYEHIPIYPHDIRYRLIIESDESEETLQALHEAVERVCPIFNLLRDPQAIEGELVLSRPEEAV